MSIPYSKPTGYDLRRISSTVVAILYIFILAICTSLQAYSPQRTTESQQINIAVIDLEGKGISQFEASTLTDRLRTSLVQTRGVNVFERARMQELLNEAGFQQTGCVSTECAVEVGKILGVQQIITGSIGKLGRTFTIDARIIDVETSKILRVAPRDYTGEIDGLLEVIREIAFELVGAEPAVPAPVAARGFGTVQVVSVPSKATVYIDGIKLGLTPFTLDELMAGQHTVKVVKERHIDFEDTFSLIGGETNTIEATLERINIVNLSSMPSGATLYLDGELKGVTPVRLQLRTRTYKIKIKKEGYADWEQELSISRDFSPNFTLLKMFQVWFLSQPPGAEVYLDNQYVGETPIAKSVVGGLHAVRFRKERYKDFQRQVVVKDGTRVEEALELLEEYGELATEGEQVTKKKGGKALLWLALGTAAAGGAYYYVLEQEKLKEEGIGRPPSPPDIP